MSQSIRCPLCSTARMAPWPSERSTTWSDDCACCDSGLCLYHQNSEELPKRPAQEVMIERMNAKLGRDMEKFNDLMAAFDEYERMRKDLIVLRAQVTTLREALKDYYHECRCNRDDMHSVRKRAYTALQMTMPPEERP